MKRHGFIEQEEVNVLIDNKTIKEMEEIVDFYVTDTAKPMFFLGIYDKKDTEKKHYTLNICKSLNMVKKMIKYYKSDPKNMNSLLFLEEIDMSGDSIPYLIFYSDMITFNAFNPK